MKMVDAAVHESIVGITVTVHLITWPKPLGAIARAVRN
jgi:hypothetical protein